MGVPLQTEADAPQRNIFLRISAHLATETDIQSALVSVAAEIAEVLPHTHFDICLIDGPQWCVSYEVGIKTRWSRRRTRLEVSPVRDLLKGKLAYMMCTNAMTDPRQTFAGATSEPIFNHNLRSRVHVGMKVMGQLIGTLNISHSETGLFDEKSLELAQHLADLLAPYFHALRLIEKAQRDSIERAEVHSREEGLRHGASRLTQALEQERQRIGMDLHDHTLADLTRLLRLTRNEAEPVDRALVNAHLTSCIRDLRMIIDEAVPSQLELFGFSHAISEHLQKAAQTADFGMTVNDMTQGEIDTIDPTVRTAIFRITQEATNNAMRHASATQIDVTMDHALDGAFRIRVRDNGVGMTGKIGTRKSGLLHMETRARLILAQLDITQDAGTCVTLRLPLDRKETRI
ncbi:GAF domain-containing sensor histidine kinase [Pacificibacter marinus]|uniref:histidine kinase n=1 Tax=Pacificibacter marinus TaxID=658057 RepID=A0A1Y5SF01_9RHOB|nr:ATP-binding protein [Pacificibacter marinus]SEK48272.1 Histidine kinase-, DNA gyrase B-, and HSP90-like ATPase [Pacificibacter marinus]SLN36444.1 Oxygen sensor histidine kinase NreB [Pacificibacter marinus]